MILLTFIFPIVLICMILGCIDWNYKAPRTNYYNVRDQQNRFAKVDEPVQYYGHLIINK